MKQKETITEKHKRKLRAKSFLRKLRKFFPDAGMMLTYKNNWELMVAVQLSAQCTDKKVNQVTPALFARYPALDDYVAADSSEFEKLIYQTGFFRAKTKNILAAAKMVKHELGGELPMTLKEMLCIPGVGRKTASVVLGNAFGITEGIAVDTHVKRLSRVLGLSDETDVLKIERDLMEIIPKKEWFHSTYLFIEYGRRYCPAKSHDTKTCPLGHVSTLHKE